MSNEKEAFAKYASRTFPTGDLGWSLGAYFLQPKKTASEAFQAGAEWQWAQQSAPAGWRELLQEVAEYAPPYGTIVAMTSQMVLGSKARHLLAAAPKTEQPPVQEPFGWYTEDHLTDKSATTYFKSPNKVNKSAGLPHYSFRKKSSMPPL